MRLVIKIGTSSLLNKNSMLDTRVLNALVGQIAALTKKGHQIVLVSSGAVGAGRALWYEKAKRKKFSDPVLGKQVLASLGQASLIQSYNTRLKKYDMLAAQLLMTRYDFRHRRHCVNIARLLEELLNNKTILPVVNENDSLAVDELMFTDNDELAGLLAGMIGADKLILLTNVGGFLKDGNIVPVIDPEKQWPKADAAISAGGRGGMISKLATAKKMSDIGITTHIARTKDKDILLRLIAGEKHGTQIRPRKKVKPFKRWLAVQPAQTHGRVLVNTCLSERLRAPDRAISILPIGLIDILQPFDKGDIVELFDEKNRRLGLGKAKYGADILKGYLEQHRKPAFIHYNALHLETDFDS